MKIADITDLGSVFSSKESKPITGSSGFGGKTFASLLNSSVKDLNNSQVQGYAAMKGIATGETKNLQAAVEKIQQAGLSLRMGLALETKGIGAYKEILKMPV